MPDEPGRPDEADLEYDLAHEVPPGGESVPDAVARVLVATSTDDDAGDYGYDLAHDVPRP